MNIIQIIFINNNNYNNNETISIIQFIKLY